jgi:hypothetical protein
MSLRGPRNRRSLRLGAALVAALSVAGVARAESKVVVTGEVIDSACYIKTGARGESHRECAQRCGEAGIPLALLEDGTGKVIWLASEKDRETPNAALRPHAGRKVTVSGTYAERGGARILVVESIKPAAL